MEKNGPRKEATRKEETEKEVTEKEAIEKEASEKEATGKKEMRKKRGRRLDSRPNVNLGLAKRLISSSLWKPADNKVRLASILNN